MNEPQELTEHERAVIARASLNGRLPATAPEAVIASLIAKGLARYPVSPIWLTGDGLALQEKLRAES